MVNLRLLRRPIPVGNQSKFQFVKLQLTFTNASIYKMCFPNGAYMYSRLIVYAHIHANISIFIVRFIIGGGGRQKEDSLYAC